ncbi:hypothetical protein FZH48_25780, partial [Salmonella enterica]|nr:hypothetical protein [Salmonella enterica]
MGKVKVFTLFFIIFSLYSNASHAVLYCQATTSQTVLLQGRNVVGSGEVGSTSFFPLTSLSGVNFPYYIDHHSGVKGVEVHAATTFLPPSRSGNGWLKINDFLEVKMLYRNHAVVPYPWIDAGFRPSCDDFGIGTPQNFARIIDRTSVEIRLLKTMLGNNIHIPRTSLYRQHWGVASSTSSAGAADVNKYLYELVLSEAYLEFPAICKFSSMDLNVNFGKLNMSEIALKKIPKKLTFVCNRKSQVVLEIHSIKSPSEKPLNGTVSFGTTIKNLDANARFIGRTVDSLGRLTTITA